VGQKANETFAAFGSLLADALHWSILMDYVTDDTLKYDLALGQRAKTLEKLSELINDRGISLNQPLVLKILALVCCTFRGTKQFYREEKKHTQIS